jgi:cobalt-zinc-cadmium efflux system outer membrane protein
VRFALLILATLIPVHAQGPLQLDDVLKSVDKNYPPLLAALAERRIAEGDTLVAESAFDTVVRANVDSDSFTYYDNQRYNAGVEQPLSQWGATATAGWRLGDGSYAPYDGKLQTLNLGEYRAGIRLPLWKDRALDSRRAGVQKARISQKLASLSIDQQRLLIVQAATRRYWDWVAAGRRYELAKSVLGVAIARDGQLREALRLGQIPAVEVIDNERAILTRRAQLVESQRAVEAAANELSLYYRNDAGETIVPGSDRLPAGFPEPQAITEDRLLEDIDIALKRRPDVQRYLAQRDQTRVDAELARNQNAPNIDLAFSATRMWGEGPVKRGPAELRAGIIFELPFQRRRAAGQLKSAEARLEQIEQREKYGREQATVEVRDAYSAVKRAHERVAVLRESVDVNRRLEDAERAKFDLGDSSLFLVNLREQSTFDASVSEVSAVADYHRAWALYQLAIAEAQSHR